jgi:hypothetical protein
MNLFKKTLWLSFFILCFTLSCSTQQLQPSSKIHKASFEEFQEHITGEGFRYVIISAQWCRGCVKLQEHLIEKDLSKNVIFIDVDENWANFFAEENDVHGVPYLIIMNESKVVDKTYGLENTIIYLRLYLNMKI